MLSYGRLLGSLLHMVGLKYETSVWNILLKCEKTFGTVSKWLQRKEGGKLQIMLQRSHLKMAVYALDVSQNPLPVGAFGLQHLVCGLKENTVWWYQRCRALRYRCSRAERALYKTNLYFNRRSHYINITMWVVMMMMHIMRTWTLCIYGHGHVINIQKDNLGIYCSAWSFMRE